MVISTHSINNNVAIHQMLTSLNNTTTNKTYTSTHTFGVTTDTLRLTATTF